MEGPYDMHSKTSTVLKSQLVSITCSVIWQERLSTFFHLRRIESLQLNKHRSTNITTVLQSLLSTYSLQHTQVKIIVIQMIGKSGWT